MTRIAGGVSRPIAAPVEGATLRGEGFPGAALTGPRALEEWANLGLADGGVFRAITPAELLRPGAGLASIDGFDSIAGEEFEFVEGMFAKDSDSRVLSLDFSSEDAVSLSLLVPEELSETRKVFPAGGAEVCEDASPG